MSKFLYVQSIKIPKDKFRHHKYLRNGSRLDYERDGIYIFHTRVLKISRCTSDNFVTIDLKRSSFLFSWSNHDVGENSMYIKSKTYPKKNFLMSLFRNKTEV